MTLLSISLPSELIAQKVSFPGTNSSTDPNKRFSVVWIEATDSTEHSLLLKDLKTGYTRSLTKLARHLDFYWAPNGDAFAVTDFGGSDFSNAWVGFPKDSSRIVNLSVDSPESKENDHVYVEVVGWHNSKTVSFKMSGYGKHDPNGYEKYYEYSISGKTTEIKHLEKK
jgi:hypothetical protein